MVVTRWTAPGSASSSAAGSSISSSGGAPAALSSPGRGTPLAHAPPRASPLSQWTTPRGGGPPQPPSSWLVVKTFMS